LTPPPHHIGAAPHLEPLRISRVPFFSKRKVERRKDGMFVVSINDDEREMLANFLLQLRDLLLSDDPLLKRLFPPAYVDDVERESDYQDLMKGDLLESRFAAIEVMEATLGQTELDETALTQWMQSINALRLVIGTSLDVSEDPGLPDPDDADYGMGVLYEVLGWLLGDIVRALSSVLPPPTGDAAAPG
jgi:hypothetical protein